MSSKPSEVAYVFAEDRPLVQRIPWGWVIAGLALLFLLSKRGGRRRQAEFEDYLR